MQENVVIHDKSTIYVSCKTTSQFDVYVQHFFIMCPRKAEWLTDWTRGKAEVIINIWFAPMCEGWYHFKLWPLYSRGLQIRIHKEILDRRNPRSGFRSLFLWSNQMSNPIEHIIYSVSVWLQWHCSDQKTSHKTCQIHRPRLYTLTWAILRFGVHTHYLK